MADTGIYQDPHDEIERLEDDIDSLSARLDSCRKFILVARIAVGCGGLVLAAMVFGFIGMDIGPMAAAMAAVLGGIVVWGSNGSTAKEAAAELATAETRRAMLIGGLDLRTVAGRPTLH